MSKKKSKTKILRDFTIYDSANAPKPVTRIQKSTNDDISWEEIPIDDDTDIIEEISKDGTRHFVSKKIQYNNTENISHDNFVNYPEIVWFLICQFIRPEDVGRFAGINRATWAITRHKSFWRMLYEKYCENHPKLPAKFQIENKLYGLRQRVIRALYHTHSVFVDRIALQSVNSEKAYGLVKHRCVNVWCNKWVSHWTVYFKFKKLYPDRQVKRNSDLLEELDRIDANPEENCKILQVVCGNYQLTPLMGMTLTSLRLVLEKGFLNNKLVMGFTTSHHNISRNIIPDETVVLEKVHNMAVFDWWHPKYPQSDINMPTQELEEESVPMLKQDFFSL